MVDFKSGYRCMGLDHSHLEGGKEKTTRRPSSSVACPVPGTLSSQDCQSPRYWSCTWLVLEVVMPWWEGWLGDPHG